jgi:hypothetical protein
MNTSGACMLKNAISSKKLTLDLTGYNAGIYYLQIEINDEIIINRKLIKTNAGV